MILTETQKVGLIILLAIVIGLALGTSAYFIVKYIRGNKTETDKKDCGTCDSGQTCNTSTGKCTGKDCGTCDAGQTCDISTGKCVQCNSSCKSCSDIDLCGKSCESKICTTTQTCVGGVCKDATPGDTCYKNDEDVFYMNCGGNNIDTPGTHITCCTGTTFCETPNHSYYCHQGTGCKTPADKQVSEANKNRPTCVSPIKKGVGCDVSGSQFCPPYS